MRPEHSAWSSPTDEAVAFESARQNPAGLVGAVAVSLAMWAGILAFLRWLVR